MTTKVQHTGIVVTNMREAKQFYVDWLKCGEIVFDGTVGDDYIEAVTGLNS